ncbi:MAG TPA: Flp family type IVb pilin [Pseudolabrys sp.]
MSSVFAFLTDESGGTAVEYGLVAAGVSLAAAAVMNTIGGTLDEKITFISNRLAN